MKKGKTIDKFKQTQDYRDISYFIDHVSNLEFRESLLEELGYRIGMNITPIDYGEKYVTIGKRNEIRMQISPKFKNINLSKCIIIEREELKNLKIINTSDK